MLPADLPEDGEPEYVAPNVSAFKLMKVLERSVNNVMVADRLDRRRPRPRSGRRAHPPLRSHDLQARQGRRGDLATRARAFMLSYVFMMIIYMTVLMYGIYVMRGVLEEKSSHVVEVMISTVKPFELMLGKILGIGAVGLTQFLICGRS